MEEHEFPTNIDDLSGEVAVKWLQARKQLLREGQYLSPCDAVAEVVRFQCFYALSCNHLKLKH